MTEKRTFRGFVFLECCGERQRAREIPRASGKFQLTCRTCGKVKAKSNLEPDTTLQVGQRGDRPELVIGPRWLEDLGVAYGDRIELDLGTRKGARELRIRLVS